LKLLIFLFIIKWSKIYYKCLINRKILMFLKIHLDVMNVRCICDMYGVYVICTVYMWHVRCICDMYGVYVTCRVYMWHVRCICDMYGVYVTCTVYMWHVRFICDMYGLYVTWASTSLFDTSTKVFTSHSGFSDVFDYQFCSSCCVSCCL
jgi:hypothetical protein